MLATSTKSGTRGFTLIELMITITVLAIALSIAIPGFRTWVINAEIRNAAESIQNGLQRARAEAVARNTNVEFVLGPGTSWVVRVSGGDDIDDRSSNDGSKSAEADVDPAGATTVTFSNMGIIVPNAGAPAPAKIDEIDITSSSSGGHPLRITIGAGGRIRMCDPALTTGARAC